jgi:rhomboid protease GluP
MMYQGHGTITNVVAYRWGVSDPHLIRAGQWQLLVTSIFLHGSVMHIAMNGLSLYWFGASIERIFGSRKFVILFLVTGILANIVSYMHLKEPSLGASGAIFGLVGAGLIFPIRWRSLVNERARKAILSQLTIITVLNLAIDSRIPGIDNWAHVGGLASGAVIGLFILPEALDTRPLSKIREIATNAITIFLVLVAVVAGVVQYRAGQGFTSATVRAEQLTHYRSLHGDWGFSLPASWRHGILPGSGDSAWRDPFGSVITIKDVKTTGSLGAFQRAFSSRGLTTTTVRVANTTGFNVLVNHTTSRQVITVFNIASHTVVVILVSPINSYNTSLATYNTMLSSIQIYGTNSH